MQRVTFVLLSTCAFILAQHEFPSTHENLQRSLTIRNSLPIPVNPYGNLVSMNHPSMHYNNEFNYGTVPQPGYGYIQNQFHPGYGNQLSNAMFVPPSNTATNYWDSRYLAPQKIIMKGIGSGHWENGIVDLNHQPIHLIEDLVKENGKRVGTIIVTKTSAPSIPSISNTQETTTSNVESFIKETSPINNVQSEKEDITPEVTNKIEHSTSTTPTTIHDIPAQNEASNEITSTINHPEDISQYVSRKENHENGDANVPIIRHNLEPHINNINLEEQNVPMIYGPNPSEISISQELSPVQVSPELGSPYMNSQFGYPQISTPHSYPALNAESIYRRHLMAPSTYIQTPSWQKPSVPYYNTRIPMQMPFLY